MDSNKSTRGKGSLPGLIKLVIFIGFIVAVIVISRATGLHTYLDQQKLQGWISGYGVWGPLIYVAVYFAAPALFFPGLPLTIAGGVLFGPFWGVVYALTGATGGACVAFLVARYLGRQWIADKIKGSSLSRLDEEVALQGWKIVAFTRLIPLFPFNLLNYAFGLTRIPFSHYAVTSFVCMMPACIAFIVFSASLIDLLKGKVSLQLVVGLVLVAAVSAIPIYYRKQKAAKEARRVNSGSSLKETNDKL